MRGSVICTLLAGGLFAASAHFHRRADTVGAETAREPVTLFIIDQFGPGATHGEQVSRVAQRALFGACTLECVHLDTLQAAVGRLVDYRTAHPARKIVINMSFGTYADDVAALPDLSALLDEKTLAVAAAGNEDTDRPMYPAAWPGVLAVAAVTAAGTKESYSNYGPHIDLAAVPTRFYKGSEYVKTTFSDGGMQDHFVHVIEGGTSFAAPKVAASAASVWSHKPELSAEAVSQFLYEHGDLSRETELGRVILDPEQMRRQVVPAAGRYARLSALGLVGGILAAALAFAGWLMRTIDRLPPNIRFRASRGSFGDEDDWVMEE
ncbi:MAG: S8 family serine peptidase [Kiritimatiellae bacterium]|nr:S8 family serine peptidase [Kiritimatiellia bacterium]